MFCKKVISFALLLCLLISSLAIPTASSAEVQMARAKANSETATVGADYGLADNIQDGVILHCFDWKYNDIKAELKNIAEAGFSAVQTSPAQPASSGEWYWLYQPYGFYIGDSPLGSKSDLQSLCTEADKYGIKVIVDVVANHLNGDTGRVQSNLQDSQYWHDDIGGIDYSNRFQVTHGRIGMRDLNSEHSYVQQVVSGYVNELKNVGVDGIRWDAAKHIGLPSEGCNFWPAVTNNGLYHYGEILSGPDDRGSGNEHLMVEYTKYMSVTDSNYGKTLRDSFASGSVPSSYGNWGSRGVSADKLVYWGESHDTWSNDKDWGFSNEMNQNVIDRAYAVAASRDGASALYLSRPFSSNKGGIHSGQKGSTDFKSKEVAAINHFHNEMIGQKDFYTTGNNCAVVCREGGAVIVAGSGGNFGVSVPNGGGITKPGTYTDEITGSKWTVTSSTISGTIGSSGIAVIYNPQPDGPEASVTPGSQTYKTDTLSLTLSYNNATSGQYSIDGGAYKTFTNGQKITIGSGLSYGTKTTVSVKAVNGSATSKVETYTYTKADPSAEGIYYDNSQTNWGEVYCYIYNDNGEKLSEWPGTKMTKESGNIWFLDVPRGYEKCYVIFSEKGNNQIPGSDEPGFRYNGSPMIYQSGNWKDHVVVKPTVPAKPVTKPTTKPTTQATQATDPPESSVKVPTTNGGNTDVKRYLYGDVDFDGKVTVKDATLIQKYCAGLESFSALQKAVSRVTGKDSTTVVDATAVQKLVAGLIKEFSVGKWYVEGGTNATDPTEKPVAKPTQPTTKPAQTATKPTTKPTTNPTTEPTTAKPADNSKKTVYFKNTSGWGSVYAYVWSTSGGEVAPWPGTNMTYVSGDVYKIVLDKKYDMIIFSDNGSGKSGDLNIPGDGYIFNYAQNSWSKYTGGSSGGSSSGGSTGNGITIRFVDTNGWGSAKIICWQNGSSNQDEFTMQSVGNNTYSVTVSGSYDKLYFSNGQQWTQHFDMPASGGTYTYNQGWS